jgi:serine/threonine-protein kinase
MVTTELGACEWFVWDLRRSNLLDRGQLDQVVSDFLGKNPRAEPPALAEYLVGQGILTRFQADRLLQGKTQGFVLGPYTLMDALGTGSMGTVYKALSKTDNRWYAVKVLPRRSMWNVRIARRKVRSFEQCRHPSVVPFVDVGTTGGMHYLAWPLVEGENLEQLVQRQGKLTPAQAALFAIQVAEGLDVCQKEGLIHGLLKPSNLMLGPDHQVRILDFGIGCLLAESEGESLVDTMSTANSVSSGLDCASPESIMDPTNLTPLGDLYSLGCILYFWLTGRYPFPDGSAAEKMMAHQLKQPDPIQAHSPDVPAELIAVVERLMQKEPDNRFRNAAEVIEALRPFAPSSASSPLAMIRARQLRERGLEPVRGPGTGDLPRPGGSRPPAPAPNLPSRETLRAPASTRDTPVPPSSPPAPAAAPEPSLQNFAPVAEESQRSWEERLGPLGIALGAILASVLAWLLTWHLFQ